MKKLVIAFAVASLSLQISAMQSNEKVDERVSSEAQRGYEERKAAVEKAMKNTQWWIRCRNCSIL